MSDTVSKSWFCVFNNPEEHGYSGTPDEIAEAFADEWLNHRPTGSCAVAFCISADGLPHLHAVLEDNKAMRFSVVKKIYPSMHIEPTKGSKEQAENYINKRGQWEEKGEAVLYVARRGEIKAAQGNSRDLELLGDLIEQGYTPNQIFDMNIAFRRFEKSVKDAFFRKRSKETPVYRDVSVIWHVGESGSGKTYAYVKLVDEHGEDDVYMMSDYSGGGLDTYCAEKILFMDEFRGNLPYGVLLQMLQGYKQQIHARYSNISALWNEVHIASVLPPERMYQNMDNKDLDTMKQLYRRISIIVYHWKDDTGFHEFALPFSEYTSLEALKARALASEGGFLSITEDGIASLPFD